MVALDAECHQKNKYSKVLKTEYLKKTHPMPHAPGEQKFRNYELCEILCLFNFVFCHCVCCRSCHHCDVKIY